MKKETIPVIKIKLRKIINLIRLKFVNCEKIIDIIAKSKYQKTPCPICGEPVKEILKLLLKMLDIKLNNAKKNGK